MRLRAHVLAADNAKKRFAVNSDLAQVAVRETQALAAESIIEGLKPKFDILPKLVENIEALNGKLNALVDLPAKVEALQGMSTMVRNLENLPTMVTTLGKTVDASKEHSIEVEDPRVSDSEEFLCSQSRLMKVLAHFGFSTDSEKVDVPKAVSSLGVSGSGGSRLSPDVSRPPPSGLGSTSSSKSEYAALGGYDGSSTESQRGVPMAGDFLMGQMNNNLSQRPLLPTPTSPGGMYLAQGQGAMFFQPGHGPYFFPGNGPHGPHGPQSVRLPRPQLGPAQHYQNGSSQNKRSSSFQDTHATKKR